MGIDPGLDGCIAIHNVTANTFHLQPVPTVKLNANRRELDPSEIFGMLPLFDVTELVVVEEVNADPKFGSGSSFTFGKGFGMILACVKIAGLPLLRVRPQQWKGKMLEGTDKSKEAAIQRVQQLYPKLNLCTTKPTTPSHDAAEAVLMALYGKQYLCQS